MADSATASLRLRKQSLGSNLNVWGDPYLNTSLDLIDFAIAGQTTITFAAQPATTTALTSNLYASDQARSAFLLFNGSATANQTIQVPNASKLYDVLQQMTLSGGAIAGMQATGGTATTSMAPGYSRFVTDGTTVTRLLATDYGGSPIENLGNGTGTNYAISLTKANALIAAAGIPGSPGTVRNSVTDGTSGYLASKVAQSGAITLTTLNPGGNEQLQVGLSVAASSTVDAATDNSLPITALALINSARDYRTTRRARMSAFYS